MTKLKMRQVALIDYPQINKIIGNNPILVKQSVLKAIKLHYQGKYVQPIKQYLQRSPQAHTADRIIAMPVFVKSNPPIAGIKWIGSHPDNPKHNFNRANAIIILNEAKTNTPIAIFDGSLISSMRTLAMSLISIDRFKPKPTTVACIGMGKLGKMHATLLPKLYPSIKAVYCYSQNAKFPELASKVVKVCTTPQTAVQQSEVVITTTSANKPYLKASHINKDKLLINLSLMDFALDVFLKSSTIVVDDWGQCAAAKKVFGYGVKRGRIKKSAVYELGDFLFGKYKSKTIKGITMVNPIGMGIEDIMVAKTVYDQVKKLSRIPSLAVEK